MRPPTDISEQNVEDNCAAPLARIEGPSPDGGRYGRVRQTDVPEGGGVPFLKEFLGTVEAALPLMPVEWRPNSSCNDDVRDDVARNDQNGLSSIGIYLRSSERYVVAKIRFGGGKVTIASDATRQRNLELTIL